MEIVKGELKPMRKFKKGDKVWFIDECKNNCYPEWGMFEANTTDKRIVISSYFGIFLLPKQECFYTKEECQAEINKEHK